MIVFILQCWTCYDGRRMLLSSRAGKRYFLWSMVVVLLALTTAPALLLIIDKSINQLQSSENAYVTAGFYRGIPAIIM